MRIIALAVLFFSQSLSAAQLNYLMDNFAYGVLSESAKLGIRLDVNDEPLSLKFSKTNWQMDSFIYNSETNQFIGSTVRVTPTPFPEYDEWKDKCLNVDVHPEMFCSLKYYEQAKKKHFDPERWEYTTVDVNSGKAKGPWKVVSSEVATEILEENYSLSFVRERSGFKFYESPWVLATTKSFASNDIDRDKEFQTSQVQVKLDLARRGDSLMLRVFYKLQLDDGTWFENPLRPAIFCNYCSRY